jgi:hypothetical protein
MVWTERVLTEEDFATLNAVRELTIHQKTPMRVMHRRSIDTRNRIIHWLRAKPVKDHFFRLWLCTQAGEEGEGMFTWKGLQTMIFLPAVFSRSLTPMNLPCLPGQAHTSRSLCTATWAAQSPASESCCRPAATFSSWTLWLVQSLDHLLLLLLLKATIHKFSSRHSRFDPPPPPPPSPLAGWHWHSKAVNLEWPPAVV